MSFHWAGRRGRSHQRGHRTGVVGISLALAAALALSACGSSTATSSASSSDSGAPQVLNVGRAYDLDSLDPHKTVGGSVSCQILCSIYDRLVDVAPDGSLAPGVADSWKFSDDGLTLTLNLHKGITFSDGTALDASAVKASLDRARTMEGSPVKADLASIADVVVVDPQTVNVTLTEPNSSLPGRFAALGGTIVNPTAIKNGTDLSKASDGSGPFEVVSFTAGSGVKLKAREGYWGAKPALQDLNFSFITDQAALTNALLAGQLDIAQVPPQNLAAFQGNDQFKVEDTQSTSYVTIIVNWQLAGLTDVRARQALLYAIDREKICKDLQQGYCELTDQPYPAGYAANDGSIDQVLYPYDPEKAKALLAQAGITNLTLTSMQWEEALTPVMQAVQEYWKAVGVNVDLQVVDAKTMVAKVLTDKTVMLAPNTTNGDAEPSRRLSTLFMDGGFANPGPVTTDKLKDLYAQITTETDPAARTKLLQAASREIAEQAQGVVLYDVRPVYVMKQGVNVDFDLSGPLPSFDGASFPQ